MAANEHYTAGFRRGVQMIAGPQIAERDGVVDFKTALTVYKKQRVIDGGKKGKITALSDKQAAEFRRGYKAGIVCETAVCIDRKSRFDLDEELLDRIAARLDFIVEMLPR